MSRKNSETSISLRALTFEDALKGLLGVDPKAIAPVPKKETAPKKKAAKAKPKKPTANKAKRGQ